MPRAGTPLWNRRIPKAPYTAAAFDPAGDLVLAGSQGYRFSLHEDPRARRAGGHVTPLPRGTVNGIPSYTVVHACGKNGRVKRTDDCP